MTLSPFQTEQLLEAYLEGRLSDADRADFERMLEAQPQLRAEVDLQKRLDASLTRMFAASESTPSSIQHADSLPGRAGFRRFVGPLAAAAAVLLVGVGAWLYLARPSGVSGPNPLRVAYQAQVDAGFKPEVICTGQAEFADWMRKYFSQPLYPEASDSVQLVGWAYAPVLSSRSGILLARVDGKPIVVIVDYAVREKRQLPALDVDGLHGFRQKFGAVVAYEVSPLDHAAVLPLLSTKAPPGLKPVPEPPPPS